RRRRGTFEQGVHRRLSARRVEVPDLDVGRVVLDAELVELLPVAEQAVGAGPGLRRATDESDAAVAEVEEVLHSSGGSGHVVRHHVPGAWADEVDVDGDA